VEVIDHHPGFEDYWGRRTGVKTDIAMFGAVCTIIYERWQSAGLFTKMGNNSATLLACGILDNTLNFGAGVSTDKDRLAYRALAAHAGLPETWPQKYFTNCEQTIMEDLETAVTNDLKILDMQSFGGNVCIGQLAVWDANEILKSNSDLIARLLRHRSPNWFMNLISLRDRSNRLFTSDETTKKWISGLLNITFHGNIAATTRHWLRKEIMQQDLHFARQKTSDS
jgi:inorganic pyrophosphatase